MESRAQGTPAASTSNSPSSAIHEKCPRSVWVLTCYGISALTVFGVLAYYFASYMAR